MEGPYYKYDQKSLRYLKTKIRWDRILFKGIGFLSLTILCFLGLLKIQAKFFHSEHQHQLALENSSFQEHQASMFTEIEELKAQINGLQATENELYRRLYLTDQESNPEQEQMMLREGSLDFTKDEFNRILDKTSRLLKAVTDETYFNHASYAGLYWPLKIDLDELQEYPTLAPLSNLTSTMIACGFGTQINPFNKKIYKHPGLDILAEQGTSVLAAGNGIVQTVHLDQTPGGSGTYLLINHGKGYSTRYSKLESTLLRKGQKVSQGQVIGSVGQSGTSIAPHLHYEVLLHGKVIDPIGLMIESLSAKELELIRQKTKQVRQSLD